MAEKDEATKARIRELRIKLGLPLEPQDSEEWISLEESFAGLLRCTEFGEETPIMTKSEPSEKEKHSD